VNNIRPALPWVFAMIMIALGEHFGLIASQPARTMFAILPALAVISIYGGTCRRSRKAA